MASDGEHLVGLWMEGQKYYAATLKGEARQNEELPIFAQTAAWLNSYFAGETPAITKLPLAPTGGEFRQAVWKILCQIPYGEVITYGGIAKAMAAQKGLKTMSSQAVGGAVGHNPISIIIPCHRVVGATGSLTGYAGGIAKKIALLTLEGVNMGAFSAPVKGTAL